MSMSRQNFEALAEMCADEAHEDLLCDATIDLLAAFCKSQNRKFDSTRFHNRIASLKATYKMRKRLAMKGINKEWLDSHVEVIV
tara:strand:- start:104 stop:355 length:252 start_codon:yes stop_codon:yes gene_type:complete